MTLRSQSRTFLSFLSFLLFFLSRLLLLLRLFLCLSFLLCRLWSEELEEELEGDLDLFRLSCDRERSRRLLLSLSLERERGRRRSCPFSFIRSKPPSRSRLPDRDVDRDGERRRRGLRERRCGLLERERPWRREPWSGERDRRRSRSSRLDLPCSLDEDASIVCRGFRDT